MAQIRFPFEFKTIIHLTDETEKFGLRGLYFFFFFLCTYNPIPEYLPRVNIVIRYVYLFTNVFFSLAKTQLTFFLNLKLKIPDHFSKLYSEGKFFEKDILF